jgi:transposase
VQLRREHASVQRGGAAELGTSVVDGVDLDPSPCSWPRPPRTQPRFEGVRILGVDEHVWHHVSTKPVEAGGRGPKELTGMVDLTRDEHGHVRARLLDLVPGTIR